MISTNKNLYRTLLPECPEETGQAEFLPFGKQGFIKFSTLFATAFVIFTSLFLLALCVVVHQPGEAFVAAVFAVCIIFVVFATTVFIAGICATCYIANCKKLSCLYLLHKVFWLTGICLSAIIASLLQFKTSVFDSACVLLHTNNSSLCGFFDGLVLCGDFAFLTGFYFWAVYCGLRIARIEKKPFAVRLCVYHIIFVALSCGLIQSSAVRLLP